MSPRVRVVLVVLLVFSVSSAGSSAAAALQQQASLSYEQFMRLSVEERLARFKLLPREDQASLRQTHAQRWLEANRSSLTRSQIELVLEAISFSAGYRQPLAIPAQMGRVLEGPPTRQPVDSEARKRADELERRLTCELGRANVTAAFTFLESPRRRSWIDVVDEWLAWFPDCALRGR